MIKSIQLQTDVDLDNCDQEPIHIPGSIQPHGVLLGLKIQDLSVMYCSANINELTGFTPESVLGKEIASLLHEDDLGIFHNYHESWNPDLVDPLKIKFGTGFFYGLIHKSDDTLIIELEPESTHEQYSLADFYHCVSGFVGQMVNISNLRELCQNIAQQTRNITGYDRVMVYRFDENYNGEIFAECKRDDLEPFLNLHYPHTDIPMQARELYMRNLMRMISDVNYQRVPILTLNSFQHDKPLDLSLSFLRSVSPIHIEYLQNMGVAATLVISLICDNKLWGMLTCHHYSAKNIPNSVRVAAKLQGHFLTSQIRVRERADEHNCEIEANKILLELSRYVLDEQDFIGKLLAEKDKLTELTGADGVAIIVNYEIKTAGKTPAAEEIELLVKWLDADVHEEFFYTNKLADHYPDAERIKETAAGILACSSGKMRGNYLIWFRPEIEQTVNWAGDPEKAVVKEKDNFRLSPRKSFELWKQAVSLQSQSWRECEVQVGIKLSTTVQSQVYVRNLRDEEEKYRMLSQKLQQINKELEHFNWISSHDMREPLRMIAIYSQKLFKKYSETLDEDGRNSLSEIVANVKRMNRLINSILEYSELGNIEFIPHKVNCNQLINDVLQELQADIASSRATIETENIPEEISCDSSLLYDVFLNLIYNAIKFRSERPLLVKISATKQENNWLFAITDNGIGISEEYKDKIFVILQKLHANEEHGGTGIGLAVVKKIIEMHGGKIWVESEPGNGSTFYFTLPF